eukprot:m.56656 g.56656  ORF g.56656 m.56656 type:complete len:239 (+) comp13026_c0_seq2:63-779(+)
MSLFDNAAEDDDDPVEVNASQQAWTSDRLMPVVASLCAQAEIHAHDEVVIAGVSVSLKKPGCPFTLFRFHVAALLLQLKLVARVQQVVSVAIFTMIEIVDHTGLISCRSWKPVNVRSGDYVYLVGRIVGNEHTKIFDLQHAAPVTDFNQITHHLLDTLFVWKYALEGPPPSRVQETRLPFLHQELVRLLSESPHKAESLAQHLTGTALPEEIMPALEFLMAKGLVYQRDSDTFAAAPR